MEKIGKLKLFIELPLGIQLKMLEFQVASGNLRDFYVFEKDIRANTDSGGFNWYRFVSNSFWIEVLEGNYDLFFKRFPESEYPKFAYAKISGDYKLCLVYKNDNLANNLEYPYIVNPEIRNIGSYLKNKDNACTIHYMSKIFTEKELEEKIASDKNLNTVIHKEEKTFPRLMLVKQQFTDKWDKRVVIDKKQGYYIAWSNAETLEDAEREVNTYKWSYGKDIDEEFVVTKEEISKQFNIPVDKIIIK